jgi:hypothetical protein
VPEVEYGRIATVVAAPVRTPLLVDAAAADEIVEVTDASLFAVGAQVLVGAQVTTVTAVDVDPDDGTGTINLADGLDAAADADDWVTLWNPAKGEVFTRKVAMVRVEGDVDTGDPIEVPLTHGLRATIPEGLRGEIGEQVTIRYDDREGWLLTNLDDEEPTYDARGVFSSRSPDNDTRVTITIALNPFDLGQDWALIEFWADDPGLAPGKVWSRFNPDDGYASLTVASPAVAGAEAEAAQLILSKNLDGEQLATLIAHQVTMAANQFQLGSLDGSSIDLHAVGSSVIQFFSNAYAPPQGFLNLNLGDDTRHTIAAWASVGIRKTLRLKGASIEFDDEETGTTTTVAELLARISDLEDRVTALESP